MKLPPPWCVCTLLGFSNFKQLTAQQSQLGGCRANISQLSLASYYISQLSIAQYHLVQFNTAQSSLSLTSWVKCSLDSSIQFKGLQVQYCVAQFSIIQHRTAYSIVVKSSPQLRECRIFSSSQFPWSFPNLRFCSVGDSGGASTSLHSLTIHWGIFRPSHCTMRDLNSSGSLSLSQIYRLPVPW